MANMHDLQGGGLKGSPPRSDTDPLYTQVRLMQSLLLMTVRRNFFIGIGLAVFGIIAIFTAIGFFYSVLPRLDKRQFVILEVEKSTGIVRVAQTLDGPFNPDVRVREFFITQVVNDFESFRKWDANERLDRLRLFIPPSSNELYENHFQKVERLVKEMGDQERRVTIGSISPHPNHSNTPGAVNQSTADVTVEVTRPGGAEIYVLHITIDYRFVGYTKAEKESTDPKMVRKMRENPFGMDVVGYRSELRVPPRKTEQRSSP